MAIECVACHKLAMIYEHFEKYPLCKEHEIDVATPEPGEEELWTDEAKEMYIREFLIPSKIKR